MVPLPESQQIANILIQKYIFSYTEIDTDKNTVTIFTPK